METEERDPIIERLLSDDMPDSITMAYFHMCLWEGSDQRTYFGDKLGMEELDRRLVVHLKQWIPHAMTQLETDELYAVEYEVRTILDARTMFPDELGPDIDLPRLAKARRTAHVQAGAQAYECLVENKEGHLIEASRVWLTDALLAKAPRTELGEPSAELCRDLLRKRLYYPLDTSSPEWMHRHQLVVRKATLEGFRDTNNMLNPLLA